MIIGGILKVLDDVHEILAGQEGVHSQAHDQVGTDKWRVDCGRWASIIGRAEREEDQLEDLSPMRPWNV